MQNFFNPGIIRAILIIAKWKSMSLIKRSIILSLVISSLLLAGCASRYSSSAGFGPRAQQISFPQTDIPQPKAQQIALLLPLTGRLGPSGQAIRNGFLAAYYYSRENEPNAPIVKVINTNGSNFLAEYQQAISDGADFVVGPLSKQNLQLLSQSGDISVPTIALNSLNQQPDGYIRNLFQFGLSPVDAAQQAAQKAWQDGYTRALVIAPAGSWGQSIAQAFDQTFQQLGGEVVGSTKISGQRNFTASIRDLLEVNQSEARASALKRVIGDKFRFVPRRREDMNVIFLAALPQQARQIKPLLNFFYAGQIPVLAPSIIYGGIPAPRYDHDLDGVRFNDMPWVLDKSSTLPGPLAKIHENITALWPKSFARYPKLYALGVDSYDLISRLNQLMQDPQGTVNGATGELFINQHLQIQRLLSWAQMQNGQPKLIS